MQDFGVTSTEYQAKPFIGDHPPIMMSGTLISGQNLGHGTVLGKITASGKMTLLAPAASDGSESAAAILVGDLDASSGDEPGVFFEHGVAWDMYLTWPAGIMANEKATAIAELKALSIFVK